MDRWPGGEVAGRGEYRGGLRVGRWELVDREGRVRGEVEHVGVANHVWSTPAELDRYQLPPPDARVISKIRGRVRGA